jgi:hypothetical protein
VAEAHDPVAARERVLDVLLRVAASRDLVDHRDHVRGRAAVERPESVPIAPTARRRQSAPVEAPRAP